MSTVSVLGSGPSQSAASRAVGQDGGRSVGAQAASASGNIAARLPVVDPVTLSPGSVGLSQQAVNTRLAQLGTKTVDIAQKFIINFASQLFGEAAESATFTVQTVSAEANASLQASVPRSASGQTTGALSLHESAHFIGQGQIVTDDGQTYAYEIEINYQADIAATQSSQQSKSLTDLAALTGKQLPEVKFPGSLADLFKILGRQLDASGGDDNSGNLSLRLLRLVNTAALLAPRAQADAPQASVAERSKAAASYSAASEIAAD